MRVRPATEHDARAIAEVHVGSWQVAYRDQIPDDYLDGLSVDAREMSWRRMLTESPPQHVTLVLEEPPAVVGFSMVAPSRDADTDTTTGEVTSIYLLSGTWRQGGGRLLMERAVSAMQSSGFRQAVLWVLATNERARSFYEAVGWQPDGAEKVDEREGFSLHEVRYRRAL